MTRQIDSRKKLSSSEAVSESKICQFSPACTANDSCDPEMTKHLIIANHKNSFFVFQLAYSPVALVTMRRAHRYFNQALASRNRIKILFEQVLIKGSITLIGILHRYEIMLFAVKRITLHEIPTSRISCCEYLDSCFICAAQASHVITQTTRVLQP